MGLGETLLLGFIAGVTIVFGLPIGRLRRPAPGLRILLNAVTVGVLVFLVWDVLSAAWEPISGALDSFHSGDGGLGRAFGYGLLFAGGISVGLLSLVWLDRRRTSRATARGMEPDGVQAAQHTALLIAIGIGLHNFAEGLAIGQSAASGAVSLATVLVIGFALHNATEGFGIVAPLAFARTEGTDVVLPRPTWGRLLGLALIGGAPTFLGTLVGHGFTSDATSVLFLTLAAGSIIYVVVQLVGVAARARRGELMAYGLLIGLLAGFVTDAVVSAGGA